MLSLKSTKHYGVRVSEELNPLSETVYQDQRQARRSSTHLPLHYIYALYLSVLEA